MLEEGLPSSPDGFSDDSIMDEGNDLSDGMSIVSDLEGRIHPPPDLDETIAYRPQLISDPKDPRRSNKRTRAGKRCAFTITISYLYDHRTDLFFSKSIVFL